MSTPGVTLSTPPIADPNYPARKNPVTVVVADVFNADQLEWLQSVLWYYELYSPTARRDEEQIALLTSVRQVLASLKPQEGRSWIHLLTTGL
jgi:hypothetical protein